MSTFKARIEDYVGSVGDDTFLGDALTDTSAEVIRAMPIGKLGFFSVESSDFIYNGIDISNHKLLSVVREHGTDSEYVECREVSPAYFRKAQDVNSLFKGTVDSPVFTVKNSKVHVFPEPSSSPNAVKLETVNFPTVTASQSDVSQTTVSDATCDTTDGDATVTMDSTSSIEVGFSVSGTGVQDGSVVQSITNSTTFELSKNATATNSNQTFTFTSDNLPDSIEDVIVLGATAKAVQYLMARVRTSLPSTPSVSFSGITAPTAPNAPSISYSNASLTNDVNSAQDAIAGAVDAITTAVDGYTGESKTEATTSNAGATTSSESSSVSYTAPSVEGASTSKGLLSMTDGTVNTDADQIDYDKWWDITAEFIENEEDAELAQLQMEKIRTYITAFNAEVADAQNAMRVSLENAKNAHEEAFLNARLATEANVTNARIDGDIEQASISSKTNASVAKMRESTGASISKMQASTNASIAKMRESTGASIAKMREATNVSLQNAVRTLEASIQDYQLEVENFRASTQNYSAKVQEKISTYSADIQNYSQQVDRYVREYSWYQDQYVRFDTKYKESLQVLIEN